MSYPPGPPPPVVYVGHPPLSGAAIFAFLLALLNACIGWCVFGGPGVLAIVIGHMALRDTRSGERRGHGVALASLFLGYLFAVPYLVIGVWALADRALGG